AKGGNGGVDLEQAFGRGLLLMHTFMDEVRFNARGNEVTLVKRPCPKGAEGEAP
ncbi:MAG: ATP-binding protein, partial [Planctomycetes bacterium]|nr:ATP-binding protein [Planctomycetota bacterium]